MPRVPSGLTPSHAQPDPKRVAAAALNLVLRSSSEPNAPSIADLRSAEGPLVLEGAVMTYKRSKGRFVRSFKCRETSSIIIGFPFLRASCSFLPQTVIEYPRWHGNDARLIHR